MAIRTAVWKVSSKPEPLLEASLAKEQFLEEMIVAEPNILSDEFMLIGRQEDTGLNLRHTTMRNIGIGNGWTERYRQIKPGTAFPAKENLCAINMPATSATC